MKLKLNLTVRQPSRAGDFAAAGVTNARRAPPSVKTAARARLLQAAGAGRKPTPNRPGWYGWGVPSRNRGNATDRELFCLLTTLTDPSPIRPLLRTPTPSAGRAPCAG